MALHLFKCIEGIELIGTVHVDYIDSYQIKNPCIVAKESNKYKLTPCNHVELNPIDYTINLQKFKILYVLNQDFLPPEMIKEYLNSVREYK